MNLAERRIDVSIELERSYPSSTIFRDPELVFSDGMSHWHVRDLQRMDGPEWVPGNSFDIPNLSPPATAPFRIPDDLNRLREFLVMTIAQPGKEPIIDSSPLRIQAR